MRITTYKRDLVEDGYRVIGVDYGSDHRWDWDMSTDCRCISIQMSLTGTADGQSHDDGWKSLISLADSDMFLDNEYARREHADFRINYAEIMRGSHPDWYLSAFKVFVGGITLFFVNPKTDDSGFLWIVGAKCLKLAFKVPYTRLGFDTIYNVHIEHDGEEHLFTMVEEDLGYIRYENEIKLKEPGKKDDNFFHDGNQYLVVTEYIGL